MTMSIGAAYGGAGGRRRPRATKSAYDEAVRAESEANTDARIGAIVGALRNHPAGLKQRELFKLLSGLNYTQYQAAVLIATKRGDIVATGKTTARRYTVRSSP